MTALTRRQVVVGSAATVAVSALPGAVSAAAPVTEVDDPEFELLRVEMDRLFRNLRANGYGSLAVETTTRFRGRIAFWLDTPDDMLSLRWAPLDDAGPSMEST
jgi:hypothetical protein